MSAGLLQPLVKELTNEQDPLTCLAALSLLKEQIEQAGNTTLKLLLAEFFLPHLEQLLTRADRIIKPTAMQARPQPLTSCHGATCIHFWCVIPATASGWESLVVSSSSGFMSNSGAH